MLAASLFSQTRNSIKMMKTWPYRIWKQNLIWTSKSSFSSQGPALFRVDHIRQCCSRLYFGNSILGRCKDPQSVASYKRFLSIFSKEEVTKDILLYKNDRGIFFKMIGVFACTQLIFWTYLTHTAYLTMRDTDAYVKVKYGDEGPPDDVKNWRSWAGARMQLSSGIWRYTITLLSVTAGAVIFMGSYAYCRKSIYRIVLRKGGEEVTIQTYGLFGLPWRFTTSLRNVSCEHSRYGVRKQLPVKVKGHRFFYILDKDGKFFNVRLFDHTVGVHRML
ncbi:transmembrane protein 223-like [Diadema setosum]|uniref:transmembrane protein 223-like n=1 Tax=Diadema setosum TaxID=31175 RepID=UPI003B3B9169